MTFANWVFGANSAETYRWLLALAAIAYVIVCLALRGAAPRHSEQMANAAGLAVLILGLTAIVPVLTAFLFPFGAPAAGPLPNGWELVVLAAGCGLVAYGAVDHAPGPAYLGVANLAAVSGLRGGQRRGHAALLAGADPRPRARHDVRRPAPARAAPARAQRLYDRRRPARLTRRGRAGAARAR